MASSLNILCAICNEFYKSDDNVYSTSCGHLFHHQCLFHWLERNASCPQCRRHCNRYMTHRVYLNFCEYIQDDEELLKEGAFDNPLCDQWVPLDNLLQHESSLWLDDAIKSGTDKDGNDVYVARVQYQNDLLPANYVPAKGGAYTPWSCSAHFLKADLQLLMDTNKCNNISIRYEWVASAGGNVPPNAIITGYSVTNEQLYTGRGQFEDIAQLPGKVHPSHGVLYMPYEGREVNVHEYEVLVRKSEANQEQEAQ